VDQSNWKWKNICVFGIKRICKRGRNWFALHSPILSWAPYRISPRCIDISLLTFTSKTCETLLRCQSYRFIVKWIALLNRWLSCNVDSCGVWLNFELMCRQWNQISLFVQAGNKSSFSFSNYIPLWSYFSTI